MMNDGRWSWKARRLGIVSAAAILVIGILYVAVIVFWLVVEATPREPIGDPYLAVMEGLTMVSALALVGLIAAIACFADADRQVYALSTLMLGTLAASLTVAVHFVQFTAVRQMWRSGLLPDYRLVWPSTIFAVEYFAWDILVGLTMILAAAAVAGDPHARYAQRALVIGGVLCLVGVVGPFSGWMLLQNVAVLGYAVALPIAAGLIARLFLNTAPSVGVDV